MDDPPSDGKEKQQLYQRLSEDILQHMLNIDAWEVSVEDEPAIQKQEAQIRWAKLALERLDQSM